MIFMDFETYFIITVLLSSILIKNYQNQFIQDFYSIS
jgi:hypothetical protein